MTKQILPIDDLKVRTRRVLPIDDLLVKPSDQVAGPPMQHLTSGPSWAGKLGTSALAGATSLLDVPGLLARFGEGVVNAIGTGPQSPSTWHKLGLPDKEMQQQWGIKPYEPTNYSSKIPGSKDFYNIVENVTGADLRNKPGTPLQDIAGNTVNFGVGNALLGGVGKVPQGLSAVGNFFRNFNTGAKIGAFGGALNQLGMPQPTADLTAAIGLPTGAAIAGRTMDAGRAAKQTIIDMFSKDRANQVAARDLQKDLRAYIGEENLARGLQNIEKYNAGLDIQHIPGVNPITPELLDNVAFNNIYRAMSKYTVPTERMRANDQALLDKIRTLGNTGLARSKKGKLVTEPVKQYYKNVVDTRKKQTDPLYAALREEETPISTAAPKTFLEDESKFAAPEIKALIDKYRGSLKSNITDPEVAAAIKGMERELAYIDKTYPNFSPTAREQLKEGMRNEELYKLQNPPAAQLDKLASEIGGKINKANKFEEADKARFLTGFKQSIQQALKQSKYAPAARKLYRLLSEGPNRIERNNLLNSFIKENKDVTKAPGRIIPDEDIPGKIMGASLGDTRDLVKLANELDAKKQGQKMLPVIKGIYVDDMLKKIQNANENISYAQARKVLLEEDNMKEKIEAIFNPDEQKVLKDVLKYLKNRNSIYNVGKIPGASDTQQKFAVSGEIAYEKAITKLKTMAQKLGAKALGLGKVGDIAIDAINESMANAGRTKREQILEKIITYPDEFQRFMQEPQYVPGIGEILKNNYRSTKSLGDYFYPVPGLVGTSVLGNREE